MTSLEELWRVVGRSAHLFDEPAALGPLQKVLSQLASAEAQP
jgi:hypothetical protein